MACKVIGILTKSPDPQSIVAQVATGAAAHPSTSQGYGFGVYRFNTPRSHG